MNAQVNPWLAMLVIVAAIGLFGVKFHADGERARTPGPSFLRTAPDGDLWLVLGPALYRFAPDGSHRETLALADFHVADLIGDIGFFSNGDLLLRAEPAAGDPAFSAGELLRCTPATRECRRWGKDRFATVFRLHIDTSDTVFIADTLRHRVLRRAADGSDQGALQEGLGYPNQLWREGDRLYVTLSDGGRQALQWFALGEQTLGDRLGSADIGHAAGVAAGHVMASDILRVGDHWWVNLMRTGQRDGGLYRFDDQWQLLGRTSLPAGADPLLMAAWQGDVLVSDFRLRRILRFAADGSARPDFGPPVLQAALDALREREQHYRRLGQAMLAAFGLLLVAGFAAGLRQLQAAVPVALPATEPLPDPADPAIAWIAVNAGLRRLQWLSLGALLLMVAGMAVLLATMPQLAPAVWLPLLAMLVLAVPMLLFLRGQGRQRIGVRGDLLLLQDGRGRLAAGRGERIFYSERHLVIDAVVVNLGNGVRSLFPQERLVQEVYPLLKGARCLPPAAMQALLWARMDPRLKTALVLGALMVLVLLAMRLGWVAWPG